MSEFTKVKDSGKRREFSTGSVRDVREGKGRYDLLPPGAIFRLARHFENGARKYGDNNWLKGQPLAGYLDSGIRHAFNILEGKKDEDHVAAAIWNFMAFCETAILITKGKLPRELDDLGYLEELQKEVETPCEETVTRQEPKQVQELQKEVDAFARQDWCACGRLPKIPREDICGYCMAKVDTFKKQAKATAPPSRGCPDGMGQGEHCEPVRVATQVEPDGNGGFKIGDDPIRFRPPGCPDGSDMNVPNPDYVNPPANSEPAQCEDGCPDCTCKHTT